MKMPRYNALLITRSLKKDSLAAFLKRTCGYIFERDGVVREIQNLGQQELPYYMKAHTIKNTHGHYLLLDFHLKTVDLDFLHREFRFDEDLIRPTVIKAPVEFGDKKLEVQELYECGKTYTTPYSP